MKFTSTTRPGRWASISGLISISLILLNMLILQPLGLNVFADDNPPLWLEQLALLPIYLTGLAAVVALGTGVAAAVKRDKGVGVYLALLFGLAVVVFMLGDVFVSGE